MKIILFSTLVLAWVQHALVVVAAQTCPCFDLESIPAGARAVRYQDGTFYVMDRRGPGTLFDISCPEARAEELVICQEQFNLIAFKRAESLTYPKAGLAESCPCWSEGLNDLPNPSKIDVQRWSASIVVPRDYNQYYQYTYGSFSSKQNDGSYM